MILGREHGHVSDVSEDNEKRNTAAIEIFKFKINK
jgi:hypothetical protein